LAWRRRDGRRGSRRLRSLPGHVDPRELRGLTHRVEEIRLDLLHSVPPEEVFVVLLAVVGRSVVEERLLDLPRNVCRHVFPDRDPLVRVRTRLVDRLGYRKDVARPARRRLSGLQVLYASNTALVSAVDLTVADRL